MKNTRGDAGYREFIRKVRIFDIADQDAIGPWMTSTRCGMHADKERVEVNSLHLD